MNRPFPQFAASAVLLASLLLGGCATGPEVRADHDRTADFASYRSFGFASPLGTDRVGYQSIVSQHLKAAAQRQLEARGLRLDDAAPQLLVNFGAVLSDKLRVTSFPAVGMGWGYYGYRSGMYAGWPLYEQTMVTPYKEGTLNIDVVDAARRQLIWEAVVTDTVTQKTLDDVSAAVDAAVAAAFAKFPIPVVAAGK